MDFKQFYKKINFDIDNEIRTVYQATQGDTKSRGLLVDLIVGGVKTPVTTETMNFFALKPDGTRIITAAVKDGDKFRIDFTNQTFAVHGTLLCALVLYGTNGEKIADKKFKMTVDESLEDGAIISKDERGILDKAFELAEDIVPRMEALATLGERLDSTAQRVDNLIATPVPTGEIIAEEIIDARDGELSLGANLTGVKEDLVENANKLKSLENANAKDELFITNYLGNSQNIHPKVLHFPNGWNGFKYWMAYTPYPNGDTTAENPCIAVSNDMIKWTVPNGLENPLAPQPTGGYNSDTHLVYRADTNTLEIWWRAAFASITTWSIHRRTSTDGVNWTAEELILTGSPMSTTDLLSPSIIFEDGKYKLWSCVGGKVRYNESTDATATTWTSPVTLDIDWGDLSAWHMDVIRTDLGYEMVVTAYPPGNNNNTADLYYLIQNFDGTFTKPERIMRRSHNPTALDFSGIYRSSILKIDGKYYIFYSALNLAKRSLSFASGENIFGLNGYIDYEKRNKPNSGVVTIPPSSTLTDFDLSNIDVLTFPNGGLSTLKSFKGGYLGKVVKLVLISNSVLAGANIEYSNRIFTPDSQDYIFTTYQPYLEMICTSTDGTHWVLQASYPLQPRFESIPGNTVLNEYSVKHLDTLFIGPTVGGVGVTFQRLRGYRGQVLQVVVNSGAAIATFENGSSFTTPGGIDYVLDSTKIGVTLVCTGAYGELWKVF